MADTPSTPPAVKKSAKKKRRKKPKDTPTAEGHDVSGSSSMFGDTSGSHASSSNQNISYQNISTNQNTSSNQNIYHSASECMERQNFQPVRPGKEPAWSDAECSSLKDFWASMDNTERNGMSKINKDDLLLEIKAQKKQLCMCPSCVRQRTVFHLELNRLFKEFVDDLKGDRSMGEDEAYMQTLYGKFNHNNTLTIDGDWVVLRDEIRNNIDNRLVLMMEQLSSSRESLAEESLAIDPYNDHRDDEIDELVGAAKFGAEQEYSHRQRRVLAKRMFQLVATKIFELRIMSSYRNKIALEKQQLLIQEEEEEGRLHKLKQQQKEAAKLKKRQKRLRQKQTQIEEKFRQEEEEAKRNEVQRLEREKEETQKETEREHRRQLQAEKDAEIETERLAQEKTKAKAEQRKLKADADILATKRSKTQTSKEVKQANVSNHKQANDTVALQQHHEEQQQQQQPQQQQENQKQLAASAKKTTPTSATTTSATTATPTPTTMATTTSTTPTTTPSSTASITATPTTTTASKQSNRNKKSKQQQQQHQPPLQEAQQSIQKQQQQQPPPQQHQPQQQQQQQQHQHISHQRLTQQPQHPQQQQHHQQQFSQHQQQQQQQQQHQHQQQQQQHLQNHKHSTPLQRSQLPPSPQQQQQHIQQQQHHVQQHHHHQQYQQHQQQHHQQHNQQLAQALNPMKSLASTNAHALGGAGTHGLPSPHTRPIHTPGTIGSTSDHSPRLNSQAAPFVVVQQQHQQQHHHQSGGSLSGSPHQQHRQQPQQHNQQQHQQQHTPPSSPRGGVAPQLTSQPFRIPGSPRAMDNNRPQRTMIGSPIQKSSVPSGFRQTVSGIAAYDPVLMSQNRNMMTTLPAYDRGFTNGFPPYTSRSLPDHPAQNNKPPPTTFGDDVTITTGTVPGKPFSLASSSPSTKEQSTQQPIGSGRRGVGLNQGYTEDAFYPSGSAGLLSPEPVDEDESHNSWAHVVDDGHQWVPAPLHPTQQLPSPTGTPPETQPWNAPSGPIIRDVWANTPAARQ